MKSNEPIVITMEGGLITAVCTATPGQPVVLINYDLDDIAGAEADEVVEVPQGEGRVAQAIVQTGRVGAAHAHIAAFAQDLIDAESAAGSAAPASPEPQPDASAPMPEDEPDDQHLSCPKCGSEHVTVAATVWVKVDVDCELDQTVGSGYEYDDASPAVCRSCGERGTVITFDPDGCDSPSS